ncbi:MAG: hypothetical protein ACQGVC_15905 [Myxococcota bacterium]
MGKIFGIGLFVAALWLTAHLIVESRAPDANAAIGRTQQAREAVLRAQEQGQERLERLLPE